MILKDYLLVFIGGLTLVICVLLGVAFLTLLERKVLGYIQLRKGPNKVGLVGVPQPFRDAIKLFSKEQVYPLISNYFIYYFAPVVNLFLALFLWACLPYVSGFLSFNFGVMFFLCCSRLGVYRVIIAGWSSNSNYSLLGGLRSVAQTISYEVRLFLILMSFLVLISRLRMLDFFLYQQHVWFLFIGFPLSIIWFVSRLAETNRAPFDFAEGESELVSGFNVEYSAGGFALIFLAEYANILFIRIMFCLVFLGGNFYDFMFFIKLVFVAFVFIWVRGTLPRYRYDKLMYLAWKRFLPVSLNYLIFFFGFKLFLFTFLI